MKIESKCNSCFWNFDGVCASHCYEIEMCSRVVVGRFIRACSALMHAQ